MVTNAAGDGWVVGQEGQGFQNPALLQQGGGGPLQQPYQGLHPTGPVPASLAMLGKEAPEACIVSSTGCSQAHAVATSSASPRRMCP